MKKWSILLLFVLTVTLLAPVALAQADAAHQAAAGPITAGFAMAIAAGACGIGQSRIASAACEGMARNPGAADAVRLAMILGLVFIETLALFTLLVVFAKI